MRNSRVDKRSSELLHSHSPTEEINAIMKQEAKFREEEKSAKKRNDNEKSNRGQCSGCKMYKSIVLVISSFILISNM